MPALPSIHNASSIEEVRRELKLDPLVVRRMRAALMRDFRPDEEICARFPHATRFRRSWLELSQRVDSELDGASKLLLKNGRGLLLEAVILRIATGRTTLCVSSQVGCAAACDFCATGKMGIAQSLSVDEILDQVVIAGRIVAAEQRRLRNIVFMGMGEPLHNEDSLFSALELLTSPAHFHHSPKRILVSSVGVTDGMLRLAERFPDVSQALSLHSVRQPVREQLIPLARKHPLDELRETLRAVNARQSGPVMIEYLMLAETNDSAEDASELAAWLQGLKVHVNLIPYNPIEGSPNLRPSSSETIHAFSRSLRSAGLKATVRYSLGADIAAACGQLVQRANAGRSK